MPLKVKILAIPLLLAASMPAFAQQRSIASNVDQAAVSSIEPPATQPALPLLRELDRETRGLYQSLQASVLRLQLPEAPATRGNLAQNDWLTKRYPNLNNDMRQRLLEQQSQIAVSNATITLNNAANSIVSNNSVTNNAFANNSAATQPVQCDVRNGVTIIVPPSNFQIRSSQLPDRPQAIGQRNSSYLAQGQLQQNSSNILPLAPNNVGMLIDGHGHLLVPQYLDRDMLGDQPIRVSGCGGAVLDARLIGSDQQTGLTVLQFSQPPGFGKAATTQPVAGASAAGEYKPVILGKSRPAEGSLVLMLSPANGIGVLQVWSDSGKETGVVVDLDGRIAGICRSGQFLTGSACQLIAEQIIRNGAVKRATLGVIITQIDGDDPARANQPLLGDRRAVRIDQVMANSVAERGGLRQGDVLLSIDGEAVTDIPTLAAAIAARRGPTRLHLLRDDKPIDLTIELLQK